MYIDRIVPAILWNKALTNRILYSLPRHPRHRLIPYSLLKHLHRELPLVPITFKFVGHSVKFEPIKFEYPKCHCFYCRPKDGLKISLAQWTAMGGDAKTIDVYDSPIIQKDSVMELKVSP